MLGLFARELWRKLRRRLRVGPVFRWRYSGRTPDRVLIVPPDLRLADAHKASEITAGRFLLGGMAVEVGDQSPFRIEARSASWRRSLDGFRWLRHLHEAGTPEAARAPASSSATGSRCMAARSPCRPGSRERRQDG